MGSSMTFFSFMYFLFLLFFFQLTSSRQPLCHENECIALLRFKESLVINGSASDYLSAYPKTASWDLKERSDCCSWEGVECDEDTSYVIKLDLTSGWLYGSLNSASNTLFNLVHLQWLSLANNDFNGSKIPYEIKKLSKLSHLNLSYSIFSGQIPPEMLELSNLESLDLSKNSLQLQQPGLKSVLEKLTNLKVLDLHEVNISSSLPQVLTNVSSLKFLSLSICNLKGKISSSLGDITNLNYLDLSDNSFEGQILSTIGNLTSLSYLDLSYNNFGGQISSSLDNLTSLSYLTLSSNNFEGTIPSSIGNLNKLIHLDISWNNFSDELPVSIGNLDALQALDVGGCQFSSHIPSSLGNLTQLSYLNLASNRFVGGNSSSFSWITKLSKLTVLDLSDLNLMETSFSLMNQTQLESLNMRRNQISYPIPYWLKNWNHHLSYLDLSHSQIPGQIPSQIGNLTQLTYLDLSSNQLQGPIPDSILELKNLESLNLYSNSLNGTVDLDMYFSKLKSLDMLVLSSNNLSVFTIVNDAVHNFQSIGLGSCNLTEFPNFLKNQDELYSLDLSSNNIPGQIPGWLLNIGKSHYGLEYLNLSNNLLTGFEQHPVLPWKALDTLDLRSNKLQGSLPFPSSNIKFYQASNNKLSGEIPPWICSLDQLQVLDLSYNCLSGELPRCLGNFSYALSILALQDNNFYGKIPESFIIGSNLRMIDLSHNNLEGKIPRSLANCTSLEFLNLGYNQIIDTFPSWLGMLLELKILILRSNRFYGVIVKTEPNLEFSKLRVIDLSHNMLEGELPSTYFHSWIFMKIVNESQLTYMEDLLLPDSYYSYAYFDFVNYAYALTMNNKGIELKYGKIPNKFTSISLSGNRFTGKIPASILNLRALKNLNLSNNDFLGSIPLSLGNLTELESLDLSNNKLSGKIPQQLGTLTSLEFLNVSHNNLTGRIPLGPQFNTFDSNSFEGNPGLCGKPLSRSCENSEASKRGEDPSLKSAFAFDWKIFSIGIVSGLIVGMVLGNQFFSKVVEWFKTIFGRQLKAVKRNRGHRN